jgi:hypothetical protein
MRWESYLLLAFGRLLNIMYPSAKLITAVLTPQKRLNGVNLPSQKKAESIACVMAMETSASQRFILFTAEIIGE